MRVLRAFAFMIGVGILTGAFSSAFAVTRAELEATWVGAGEKLTYEKFSKVIDLMKQFPESNEILKASLAKLGTTDPKELFKTIQMAPGLQSKAMYQSESGGGGITPNTPGTSEADIMASFKKKKNRRFVNVRKDGAFVISEGLDFSICMLPGTTLADSFLSFAHELVHFVYDKPFKVENVLEFADGDAYAKYVIGKENGELRAYSAEGGLEIQLKRAYGLKGLKDSSAYFDADGKLVDPAGLESYISQKMGYKKFFNSEFPQVVLGNYQNERRRLSLGLQTKTQIEQFIQGRTDPQAVEFRAYLKELVADIDLTRKRLSRYETQFWKLLGLAPAPSLKK